MHALIEQFKLDHRKIVPILHVLQSQLSALAITTHEDVDLELMRQSIQYLAVLPKSKHDASEQIIYDALIETGTDYHATLIKLRHQHTLLTSLNIELQETVELGMSAATLPVNHLLTLGNQYLNLYLEQIHLKEDVVFPAMQANLTTQQWREIKRQFGKISHAQLAKRPTTCFDRLIEALVDFDYHRIGNTDLALAG